MKPPILGDLVYLYDKVCGIIISVKGSGVDIFHFDVNRPIYYDWQVMRGLYFERKRNKKDISWFYEGIDDES